MFLEKTEVPEQDNWRSLSNDEIWERIIKQVIAMGTSIPIQN